MTTKNIQKNCRKCVIFGNVPGTFLDSDIVHYVTPEEALRFVNGVYDET